MRVAVVGAGPAGCAAAVALCRRQAQVVLISDAVDGVGEQLSPSARPLLEQLDLLPLEGQLECVGVRAAWESAELRGQDFLFHPFGHGWLLDRQTFGAALRHRAVMAGAQLREPVRLVSLERRSDWYLHLTSGELRCDWVVDATGRRSVVARLLGVRRRRLDQQIALVGWLETARDDTDATLTVETASNGWWYTCRLPGQRRVAAWITGERPDRALWEAKLRATRHLSRLVEGYRTSRSVVICAADSSMLERSWGPGWLAIGDAVASYDPLASRGMVSAIRSGLEAAGLVDASAERLAANQNAIEEDFRAYIEERRQYYTPALQGSARRGVRAGSAEAPSPSDRHTNSLTVASPSSAERR